MSELGPSQVDIEAQGTMLAQEIATLRSRAKTDAEHAVVIQKLEALHQLFGAPLPDEKKVAGSRIEVGPAVEAIGAESFFGPAAVEKAFGIRLEAEQIPPIQFTQAELERAKALNQMLVLRVDRAADGSALTMQKMQELLQPIFNEAEDGTVLYYASWYQNEDFYTKETPAFRWALVSKEVIPDSTNKNYLEQTDQLVTYLQTEVFQGQTVPEPYADAIREYQGLRDQLAPLVTSNVEEEWKRATQLLADLKLTQLTRQTPADVLYDLLTVIQNSPNSEEKTRLLESTYTWTARRTLGGYLVDVGRFDADGAFVRGGDPGYPNPDVGVVVSRSQ